MKDVIYKTYKMQKWQHQIFREGPGFGAYIATATIKSDADLICKALNSQEAKSPAEEESALAVASDMNLKERINAWAQRLEIEEEWLGVQNDMVAKNEMPSRRDVLNYPSLIRLLRDCQSRTEKLEEAAQ